MLFDNVFSLYCSNSDIDLKFSLPTADQQWNTVTAFLQRYFAKTAIFI